MEWNNFWVTQRKEELLEKFLGIRQTRSFVALSEEFRFDRNQAKDEFQELVILEEIKWRQKS